MIVDECIANESVDTGAKMNSCMSCGEGYGGDLLSCYSGTLCKNSGIDTTVCEKLLKACHKASTVSGDFTSNISDSEIGNYSFSTTIDDTDKLSDFKSCVTSAVAGQYSVTSCSDSSNSAACQTKTFCSYATNQSISDTMAPYAGTAGTLSIKDAKGGKVSIDTNSYYECLGALQNSISGITGVDSVYDKTYLGSVTNRTAIEKAICMLLVVAKGRIARAIVAALLISYGVMLLLSKFQWTHFLVLSISTGLIFGGGQIALTFFIPKNIVHYDANGNISVDSAESFIKGKCPHAL
jgi:type IV secretory pathway VirB2 component (pilin)